MDKKFEEMMKILQKIVDKNKKDDYKIVKMLGKGGFGLVVELNIKNKTYAGKLIRKNVGKGIDEADLILDIRGPGIVKVNRIHTEKDENNYIYHLIVMEKAPLKSLSHLNEHIHFKNIFNLIFESPFELVGNNLIRFYAKQIIKGLEILDRSNFSHFDLKPENILTFSNIVLKLTDFGLLNLYF